MKGRAAPLLLFALLPAACLQGPLHAPDDSIFSLFNLNAFFSSGSTGQLDTSFGGSGAAIFDSGFTDNCLDIALLSDDSVVTTGVSFNGAVNELIASRYSAGGLPVLSFGTSGTFHYNTGSNTGGIKIRRIAADQLILAGYTTNAGTDTLLLKIDASGNLDPGFGTAGVSVFDLLTPDDSTSDLVIDHAGRPVLSLSTGDQFFMAARFTASGALDTAFNGTGIVQTPLPSGQADAYAIAVDASNRVIAGGYDYGGAGTYPSTVIRYTSAGALDTAFAGTGIVQTDLSATVGDAFYSVIVQPDGKIVAAGYANVAAGSDALAVVRYLSNGSLDASFGTGGIVLIDVTAGPDSLRSVTLQPDGKIVAAGTADAGSASSDMVVVRLHPGGALDTSFGGTGVVRIDISGFTDYGSRVLLQSDGAILVAGTASNGANNDAAIVRLY